MPDRLLYIFTLLCCLDISGLSAQTVHDSLLFERINDYRVEQGLVSLVWDSCMWYAAKHQSDHQCAMGKVTHGQTPYSKFKNWNAEPSTRILHFCPQLPERFGTCAENVGPGNFSGDEMEWVVDGLVSGWIRSTGHRANLLFDQGIGTPRGAVAISCGCEGDSKHSKWCYGTFVVRQKHFTDQ
jgi:hypothetical protein